MSTDQSNPYVFRVLLSIVVCCGLILAVFLCLYIANHNKFFDAASHGTVEDIEYFIEHGVSVNEKSFIGLSLLHYAVIYNPDIDILKYLIDNGADVKAKADDGATSLDYAIGNKEREVILRDAGGKRGEELPK